MPVVGGNSGSYNQESFWYYPWGRSGTHKGVDIFATKGTRVISATKGLVVYRGRFFSGGNVVLVLGPKWRMHYYAHLDKINTSLFALAGSNKTLGTVGNTGNAKNTPSHLHFSTISVFPYPWLMDKSPQGWKKMFYLNPVEKLNRN